MHRADRPIIFAGALTSSRAATCKPHPQTEHTAVKKVSDRLLTKHSPKKLCLQESQNTVHNFSFNFKKPKN